jgi:hypothetical protein
MVIFHSYVKLPEGNLTHQPRETKHQKIHSGKSQKSPPNLIVLPAKSDNFVGEVTNAVDEISILHSFILHFGHFKS